MKSKANIWICVVGVLSVIAFIFFNLEWFPGLHGDEAWVGLYASRVKANGLYTPHLMNTYTGAMFGWMVHRSFETFGTSIFGLRFLSAFCNSLAAIGFVVWSWRRFGSRGAVVMTGLLASSMLFLFYGRLAWEVCAFEHLLILAILWSCRPFVEEGRFPVSRLLVFFGAIEFGILNHFIFLSIPLSLAVYAAAGGALLKDWRAARLRPLFFLSVLLAVVCYCKSFVTPTVFVEYRVWFLAVLFLLPFAFTAFFRWGHERFPRLDFLDGLWARRILLTVIVLGSISFCIWHLAPMIQIYSGVALFRRVVSFNPLWPVRWVLYAWGAGLLGMFFVRLAEIVRTPSVASEGSYARFILLWTASYLAVFILMRHTSSIRYYIVMHALTLAAIAISATRTRFLWRPRNAAIAAVFVLGLHSFGWVEASTMPARQPSKFRVGFRLEKSIDFIDKRELFARTDSDGVCEWDHSKQDFLYIPAIFHRNGHPVTCDRSKMLALDYCWDCKTPPFYSYSLVAKE